jgi:3-phenylpropionate/cinnamic acid dioxygenase small subunit
VLCAYGMHHDARDFKSLADCFTDDVAYRMQITGTNTNIERRGSAEVVDQIRMFKDRQTDQRRHVITNFLIVDVSSGQVMVRSYVTVLAVQGEQLDVVTCGEYRDVVVRTPSGWRIAEKTLVLDKGF